MKSKGDSVPRSYFLEPPVARKSSLVRRTKGLQRVRSPDQAQGYLLRIVTCKDLLRRNLETIVSVIRERWILYVRY